MESLLLKSRFTDSSIFSGNSTTPLPSLPYCHPQNDFLLFVSQQLQTCIPTPATFLSTLCGTLSITSWLFAQLPQIIKNYRLKSSESLSFLFILIWCFGDSSNFVGAVLLNQMTFQKVIAAYYVAVDVVLVWQWIQYSKQDTEYAPIPTTDDIRRPSEGGSGRDKESRAAAVIITPPPSIVTARTGTSTNRTSGILLAFSTFFNLSRAAPITTAATTFAFFDEETIRILGIVIGWSSTFLYLSSRLPQIYLNHKRRSVSGLSPLLFLAAFCGNFFYSSSLLLNPSAWHNIGPFGEGGWVGEDGTTTSEWWTNTLPFLLGSAGVLAMDGYIGLQFWKWGGNDEEFIGEPIVQVIVGIEGDDENNDDERPMKGRQVTVSVEPTKERSYFNEQTALLAQMNNGVYGTSAGSSSSSGY
ncbi:hypothetical protein TWF225_009091 [Orbilia oligospora]|nr:hypothetical protein TWF225_009091 [Orbilia oligospora]KAF3235522.1 hypothetical protein TWF217_003120 [Orbilia oligospora]KAF3268131.1 hypothetical protein TWF128_008141 [Orbilia oligospora]KAF3282184.1 hypothetical protein TWF132_010764 [Orbilia oligospora]